MFNPQPVDYEYCFETDAKSIPNSTPIFRSLFVEKQGELDPPEYDGMQTLFEIFEKTSQENAN